jgi:hypothetical protein
LAIKRDEEVLNKGNNARGKKDSNKRQSLNRGIPNGNRWSDKGNKNPDGGYKR